MQEFAAASRAKGESEQSEKEKKKSERKRSRFVCEVFVFGFARSSKMSSSCKEGLRICSKERRKSLSEVEEKEENPIYRQYATQWKSRLNATNALVAKMRRRRRGTAG